MIALVAAAALGGDPSVVPVPIGPGARFRPAAHRAAAPALICDRAMSAYRIHLELFAQGKVIVVPAGIGRGDAGCTGDIRTTAPGGIVDVARRHATLGDLFRVWGERLTPNRLLSFPGNVRVYVAGRRMAGNPVTVALTPNAEIVVEVGPTIPPHRFFLFPKGS